MPTGGKSGDDTDTFFTSQSSNLSLHRALSLPAESPTPLLPGSAQQRRAASESQAFLQGILTEALDIISSTDIGEDPAEATVVTPPRRHPGPLASKRKRRDEGTDRRQ